MPPATKNKASAARVSHTVFISYSRQDRVRVNAAVELLRAGGVQVFLDVVDLTYGDQWKDALLQALRLCERVMVFWSKAASASEWVEREWRFALSVGKRIVPTLLDQTPLPGELANLHAVAAAMPPKDWIPRPWVIALLIAGVVVVGGLTYSLHRSDTSSLKPSLTETWRVERPKSSPFPGRPEASRPDVPPKDPDSSMPKPPTSPRSWPALVYEYVRQNSHLIAGLFLVIVVLVGAGLALEELMHRWTTKRERDRSVKAKRFDAAVRAFVNEVFSE